MTDQFKLRELLGISIVKDLASTTKQNLKISTEADLEKYEHWDVIIYSAITEQIQHPMVSELKVLTSTTFFYEGMIKQSKFDGLMKIIQSDKARKLGTRAYMINMHPNHCNIIDLCAIQKAWDEGDIDVGLFTRYEPKNNIIKDCEYVYNTYYKFHMHKFSEQIVFNPDFDEHKNRAIAIAREKYNKNIKWEDD